MPKKRTKKALFPALAAATIYKAKPAAPLNKAKK